MEQSKYILTLSGLEMAQNGQAVTTQIVKDWIKNTGAKSVTSGMIHKDFSFDKDNLVFSCYFDSSYWTGLKTS